ncbi:MAG: hypothetical protein B7Y99_05255 [Caulobacterales bacterium 32-69-10]|nr:MAG: hypothetical protein B7Y99_05255 [Caulobacterales bacterium 32-69-10]
MTKRILVIAIVAVLAVAAAGYGWWRTDLRWRPKTLTAHEAEIAALVETAGWVSPGKGDKVLYLVGFRACPDCIRFEKEQFPLLQGAGVDTRVILFPRRTQSDAAERAGVAELWKTRSWETWERWSAVVPAAWTAEGIVSADTDPERAALVEKSRRLTEQLKPLLADNGIRMAYPTLIWRDARGRLRGCACERRETYKYVRKELGA